MKKLWDIILTLFKKEKGIYTARPRIIEFDGGTISLQGYSTEKADRLEAILTNMETVSGVPSMDRGPVETPVVPTTVTQVKLDLPEVALGYSYNRARKEYELAEIHYDPATKDVNFTSLTDIGDSRQMAIAKLKIAMVEKGFVG